MLRIAEKENQHYMKYALIATIALTIVADLAKAQQLQAEIATKHEIQGLYAAPASTKTTAPILTENIKVYPTQCINTLAVDNNKNDYLNYRILNYDGREISGGQLRPLGTSRINVSGYPAGTYLLFVTWAGDSEAFKFFKM